MTTIDAPASRTDRGVALHPLLAERWSPRAFDPTPLADDEVASLLEAARWAPSAGNAQPWRFLVGRIGVDGPDLTHVRLTDALSGGNRAWAHRAPLLVASVVRIEDDGVPRAIGPYELGLAVASLSLQAEALGMHAHQMGGFDADRVAADFAVPTDHRVVSVVAVGFRGDVSELPDWAQERENAPRTRLPLSEIAYAGSFGRALDLTIG